MENEAIHFDKELISLSTQARDYEIAFKNQLPDIRELSRDFADLDAYFEQIRPANRYADYASISRSAHETCLQIEERNGPEVLADFHRWSIAHLITHLDPTSMKNRFPDEVLGLYLSAFVRILDGLSSNRDDHFSLKNDSFVKDLSLCQLKLIPCGAEHVDSCSGIPRRMLFQGGLGEIPRRFATIALSGGGFRGWYESHWDRRLVRKFNPAGYEECYRIIGRLLEKNPSIKGTYGVSWWYDPAMDDFGPELSFLRLTPLKFGARLFRLGSDEATVKDALTMSAKRKQAFDRGVYVPTNYMLIWPRRAVASFLNSRLA